MKKLLSICFLSIFLMMFGMQAQAQIDCCFQLSNPAADTLHGIANLPGGDLPLSHYMSPLEFGHTDVYDMIFSDANCLGIDDGAKVSVELELWVDGPNGPENVLDGQHDLNRYCNITLQTAYEELHWVGTPMLQENYSFVYEYPGAIPIFSGTYNISNVAFDYFYFRFLTNTHSRIVVTWNQIFRDVKLIVHIRERLHGTDNSLYWNSHVAESEYYQIGGHQSHPGRILASDTLPTDPIIEKNDTIKDCEPVTVGMPPYTMDTTGDYKIAYVDTTCGYRIDSIVNYNYTHYVHPTTPTLSDSTITYCQRVMADSIALPAEPNPALADHVADIVAYWSVDGTTFTEAAKFAPNTDVTFVGADTSLIYYVKRHDNVTGCESEVDTFKVKITPIPADPVVTNPIVEYCVGSTATALSYPAPAGQQVLWGESADNITSTTAPTPSTATPDTLVYYLKLQDIATVNQCISDGYDSITVRIFANPVVKVTADNDTLCFGEVAVLTADPSTLTSYSWKKNGANTDSIRYEYIYTNDVTAETTFSFRVDVTEAHDSVTCVAADSISILAYPEIEAPTEVRGDTLICGPATITRAVALPATGTKIKWYAADKTTELGTGLTYTQLYEATTTIYASALNDFGCETPAANWVSITVTVDTIPEITLTADNGGEVCAESDLTIHSSVVSSYMPVDYLWSGIGLKDPKTEDSVIFNHNVAGVYTDTLKVTDVNGCFNTATIDITVDSLPIIVLNVNYTIKDDSWCVGDNGKIEFTTPDYVKYSIDSGLTWKSTKVFDSLAVGRYLLMVENSKGCKNHATPDSVRDAIEVITLYLSMDTNTHCYSPFGGSITVDSIKPVAGAYHYRLVNTVGDTTAYQTAMVFEGLVDGDYTVLAEDTVTGCTASANITVEKNYVSPTASFVGPDLVCYLDSTTTFTLTSTEPNVVFTSWDYIGSADSLANLMKYDTTFVLGGFPAGKHIFIGNFMDTVTNCIGKVRDTVRVNSVNINLISDPSTFVCAYDTITVYSAYFPMEPTEDTIVTYTWYNGNYVNYKHAGIYDTVIVIPTVSSNYISLVAIDNHGCKNTFGKTMNVWPLPELTISGKVDYCQDAITSIAVTAVSAPDYHYVWDTTGVTVKDETKATPSELTMNVGKTDYSVHVTVTDGHGCISDSTIAINVIEVPGAPVFTPDTQYYCDNNVTISGKSQLTPTKGDFSWNGDDPEVVKTTGDYSAFYTYTENGVSCYSDTTKLRVEVKGAPVFTVAMRYNGETTPDMAHTRCYDPTAKDTVKVSVNPAASSTLTYTYELNGVVTTDTAMVITRTDAGSYIDTIHISVVANYPDGTSCTYDDTVYYHLTINGLPAVPDNFPYSYNGGDSTIFYCQGDTAVYNFNIPAGYTATYNGSTTAPKTAADNVKFVMTETATGCQSTFYYDIVEVATPKIVLTSDLADDCHDTLTGKVIATVTPTFDATYERVYAWTPATVVPASPHSLYVNTDTVTYTFTAPNDTIVSANVTVNAVSGPVASYSAACASNDTSFILTFQPAPDMPKLNPTYSMYIDSANAAYCFDVTLDTITTADFITSTGANVAIVDYTTIDSAGVYKVVANNTAAPYCPSDTLIFTVTRNRELKAPTKFADYAGKIYYCEGSTPVYDFGTAENTNDSLVYFKGTTALTVAPDTAGSYTLRVYDKASVVDPLCSKDFSFEIIEVKNPTATVTPHTNWIDTNKVCEGQTIDKDLDFTITSSVTYHAVETFAWKGVSSTDATGHFTATPTADTSVSFSYVLVDTVGSGVHGVACPFTYDSTIHFIFYATPNQPVYTGDTAFCAGDTVFVTESEFSFATGLELTTDNTLPDTIYAASKAIIASVHYPTFTSCKSKDTLINIVRHELPTVVIAPADTTICKGDTATFTASGAATYVWSTSETTDFIKATDTAKYVVVGTDVYGCVNTDTATLKFFDVYTVKVSNDTVVCLGEKANIAATVTGTTGAFTLTWYKDTASTALFGPASFASGIEDAHVVTPDTSAIVNGMPVPTIYRLEVIDSKGCKNNSNEVKVAATNRPQFEFREIGGTESIRYIEVNSGDQSAFEMYIKQNCWDPNVRVFVDFQIYKDGVPMTTAELANTMDDYLSGHNTSYSFDLTTNAPAITTQTMRSSNYNTANDFFPQSEFLDGTSYDYDWFFMHFINDRKITVNTGAWKPNSKGVYTFHYAVVIASGYSAQNGSVYNGLLKIGGHSSHAAPFTKDTIAYDYFTICVDTTYVGASTDFIYDAPAVVTTSEETSVAAEKVDMRVYPNPASNNVNVVLEGVSGQTVITIHDMSGKAVSSMRVDVDNNGQIFNLPVDNYSQGIYFIKAINGDAVMTKKLIIAR